MGVEDLGGRRVSYAWTQADVGEAARVASSVGIPPLWLFAMLSLESALQPTSHRASSDFWGLNQLNGAFLRARGIDPGGYLQSGASVQLASGVGPYLRAQVTIGPLSTLGRVELAQLKPAALANRASDFVVYAAPSQEYEQNRWLDLAGKGAIMLSDLEAVLARHEQHADVRALAARAGAPLSSPKASHAGELVAVVLAGAASFLIAREAT